MTARGSRARGGLRRQLATLTGACRVYWRAAPATAAMRLAVAVSGGAAPVAVAWLTKLLLDRAAGLPGPPIAGVAAALATVGGVAAVLQHAARYLDAEIVRRVSAHTQTELFAAVSRDAGLATLEDPAYHDRVQLAQQPSQSAPVLLTMTVLAMAQSLVTVAGFAATLVALFPVAAAG
ncbi:ABC transporter ATP-binding protein, partial [Dactylosporangium sp. NPDC000555]